MPSTSGASLAITSGIKTAFGSTGTFTNTTTGASALLGGATVFAVKP